MAAGGGERIVLSLLSVPKMSVRAYLAVIPYLVRKQVEEMSYKSYIADCLQAIAKNTTNHIVPGVSDVIEVGTYIQKRWKDIIDLTPEETRTSMDIIEKIKLKLIQMGGGNA